MPPFEKWPPKELAARTIRYEKYRQLFRGQHHDVYARVQAWLDAQVMGQSAKAKEIVYIVCNFAGLLSKLSADMLFGKRPRITVGEQGSKEQNALDVIVTDNYLHVRNYEMALGSSYRGDAVYKVRFGKFSDWAEAEQPIIEPVNPAIFVPINNPDNIQELKGAILGWVRELNDRKYLRLEIHEPGVIKNELWRLEQGYLQEQVKLGTFKEYAELPEVQETRYPGLLVEHVPNWRLDDMWEGISDYDDLESLMDELNNRMSRISRILDKHENPKLILPPGIMRYDERTRRYYIEKEALDAIEVDQGEVGDLPKYLVWDAQLEAAFKQIDQLLQILFLVSETSPDAFGLGKQGVSESGRALKFRLLRLIGKINRKQLYFHEALKNVLYAAQVLDVEWGKGGYEPRTPSIEWPDPLPKDPVEASQTEATRKNAGLTSTVAALKRLDDLEGDQLEDELKRIREENRPSAVEAPKVTLPESGEE